MTYQQHGVTIGDHTYTVDENGKFVAQEKQEGGE